MRTITLRTNVIAILALTALFPVCRLAGHGNGRHTFVTEFAGPVLGTIGGAPAEMWFHVNAQFFDDGTATGTLQVRVVGGESFLYRVVQGEATVVDETVVEVILTLERVGEDGTPSGETDVAIVRPSSTIQDRLIYDLLGPTIHLEAPGTIGFRHEHTRPE